MATKTTKKTTVKPAAAKKAPAKKVVAKKPAAKKPAAPKKIVAAAPVAHECACGHNCQCGAECKCHHGCKGARFLKKLVIFLVIFALGFAAAKLCPCNKRGMMRGPRVNFVEGCLDAASVKCPKLVEALPAMDINQDGCITRDEFRAVKREMRREIREMQVQVSEEPAPVEAPAEVVAE